MSQINYWQNNNDDRIMISTVNDKQVILSGQN